MREHAAGARSSPDTDPQLLYDTGSHPSWTPAPEDGRKQERRRRPLRDRDGNVRTRPVRPPIQNRCLSPLASNITEVRIVVVADMNLRVSRPDLGFPVRCNILLRPSQTRKEVPDARQTVDPGGSRFHHRVPSDGRL